MEDPVIIQFNLLDKSTYNFNYFGYSEYIDILETTDPIEILDPFTIEDLEKAYQEYLKFVNFKHALSDNKKKIKLWSKEELEELIKYNLENQFLKFLVINETLEEKRIKWKLLTDNTFLTGEDLNLDIIDFYINDTNGLLEKMNLACLTNNINVSKWLYSQLLENLSLTTNTFNKIFADIICKNGYLEMAKWLYSTGSVTNIHYLHENAFYNACSNNHLELAKWIYSLETIDINIINDYIFRNVCKKQHLNILKWLYSLKPINIHSENDEAFITSCLNGNLEIAQWLYSLDYINIHENEELIFRRCCFYGRLEIVQWLISLGDLNVSIKENMAFSNSCYSGNLDLCKYLYSLGCAGNINTNNLGLCYACTNGHLEIAKWLYELSSNDLIELNINNLKFTFCESIINEHLEVVDWIYSIQKMKFDEDNPNYIHQIIKKSNLKMAKWLYEKKLESEKPYSVAELNDLFVSTTDTEISKWLYSLGVIDLHYQNDLKIKKDCYENNLEMVKWLFTLERYDLSKFDFLSLRIRDWYKVL